MNTLHAKPVRERARLILLAGMSLVLILLVVLGIYAVRSLSDASRASTLTTREYLQRGDRLEDIHLLLSSATNSVRDYLLDPDSSKLSDHREQARRSWSQALKAVEAYKSVAAPSSLPLTQSLDAQTARYWEVADRSLKLQGDERPKVAVSLLLHQLVPARDQFLSTISELGSHDRDDLNTLAESTARFVKRSEDSLWSVVAFTVILALIVAGATFRYLMRLENAALVQYAAIVRAGIELEKLSGRLLTLQEDERRRIARELHDDFGQRIASLLFELSAASQREDASAELRLSMQEMEKRLGDVAKDLQALSRSLHSAVLEKIGLEAAIRSDCTSLAQRGTWQVDFQTGNVPRKLPEPLSLALYRVFQESLQNALKHSRANRLEVSLEAENRDVVLRVKDFGRGFDTESAGLAGSLGLVSMRERLRTVGGSFAVHSEIGNGTQIEARVALPDNQ